MKTTVSSKGQIVLPAEFRRQDRIEAGQAFEVEQIGRGEYRLKRHSPEPNEGALDWLLDCPEKGFFVPIESEIDRYAVRYLVDANVLSEPTRPALSAGHVLTASRGTPHPAKCDVAPR